MNCIFPCLPTMKGARNTVLIGGLHPIPTHLTFIGDDPVVHAGTLLLDEPLDLRVVLILVGIRHTDDVQTIGAVLLLKLREMRD